MNKTYVKIKEDGTLEYAPDVLDGFYNPSEARRRAHGYLPEASRPPPETHRDGFHWEPGPWEVVDGEVARRWVETPDPPRVFSTADVIEALMKAGVWPQVRAFIEERGMLDMVLATKEFRADDPNFTGPRDALKEQLGWTDEQVEQILAASVKEGY